MLIIGTTLAKFAMSKKEAWSSWLGATAPAPVRHFAAVELDGDGSSPFGPLYQHPQLDCSWNFTLQDGRTSVDMANRHRHIAMGQSLVMQYASDVRAEWLLLLAADCAPEPDWWAKLMEAHNDHGSKALTGQVTAHPRQGVPLAGLYPREIHPSHGGFILLHADIFTRLRSRADVDVGDDYAMVRDIESFFDESLVCRTDVRVDHYTNVTPYAQRYNGKDLEVRW